MKILIDHNEPFLLTHGGFQILIEKTAQALRMEGLDVEYLRWWDPEQKGDVIHFFGRANPGSIHFAHGKGIKYVMHELLTSQGSRSKTQLRLQGLLNKVLRRSLPSSFRLPLRWDSYRMADAILASTGWEAWIMRTLFDAPASRLHIIPTGADDVFFKSSAGRAPVRNSPLVCVATITERKRVLELARAAAQAGVPLTFIGKPYSENDPYYLKFLDVVKKSDGIVSYRGAIGDHASLAPVLQQARGFVLLSTMETQSLAAMEAAAAGCPLLLSDLPWARDTFGDTATYLRPPQNTGDFSSSLPGALRAFNDNSSRHASPPPPATWSEVARQLVRIYKQLLIRDC
ncbi:MAG: glycosyltransferase [Verrucomicrobiaceae bacterium]|nr:MAG: glycosyltransferase [Verrucomicrobiaceae bacterium]